MKKKVLMVCLGNICRSPTAEAILRSKAEALRLNIEVDSAGTANYHIGEPSDPRSIKHAELRGYKMTHKGRQLTKDDFEIFDHILVMDHSNFHHASQICPPKYLSKLEPIAKYDLTKKISEIPDPYHSGPEKFEAVINYLEICIDGFLTQFYCQ